MDKIRYKSSITTGSLLVRESQVIARLLLEHLNDKAWHQAIVIDNLLQKRSPESAKIQARLIKERLKLMKPELWKLIDTGTSDVVTQALLAASIKHSPLLGDFMYNVIKPHWQVFKKRMINKDWHDYLETCAQIDPHLQKWSNNTRTKLRQIIFRILFEAKYIENTRSLELLPVSITNDVKTYLLNNSENYVLKCMEITP
jgi:hypothetical protein